MPKQLSATKRAEAEKLLNELLDLKVKQSKLSKSRRFAVKKIQAFMKQNGLLAGFSNGEVRVKWSDRTVPKTDHGLASTLVSKPQYRKIFSRRRVMVFSVEKVRKAAPRKP